MFQDVPAVVLDFLAREGFGEVISAEPLTGGVANQVRRVTTTSQSSFVLKQNAQTIERLFECEAAGLQALREAGMHTPDVLAAGPDFLLLEDLGSAAAVAPDWEAFGRAVARQHLHSNDRFGFAYDNFLGPLRQINTWAESGHEFFGHNRVLRYLPEPKCEQTLTPQDRQDLERLVQRLPDLIPEQPPALLHGDLWHTNIVVDSKGVPALIDPAVYYGWPEAELSMTRQYGEVPDAFFDAYNEVNPLHAGWWDRLELLYIREYMAVIALFGNEFNTLESLRRVITKFG
jgi:fructosamine-3-kinase